MEAYEEERAPPAFGLDNTGAVCYFNSLLQLLAGCTALASEVGRQAEDALARTRTGRAFAAFFRGVVGGDGPGVRGASASILAALLADLGERKPEALKAFGPGQQSASETFVFLMEMLEPPGAPREGGAPPVGDLFRHRFRCEAFCRRCRRVVSTREDSALVLYLGHIDRLKKAPADSAEFAAALGRQVSALEDFDCPGCGVGAPAVRVYTLTLVPEILLCSFDLYTGAAPPRRYFPERMEFPAVGGGALRYRLLGQVEHSGGLGGGHYWARALRAGGAFVLNDASVAPARLAPTANTYLAAYHYEGRGSLTP